MKYVYVSIGNSDDKLTQAEWSEFCNDVYTEVIAFRGSIHGRWFSPSSDMYQNACICFEISDRHAKTLKTALKVLARQYGQEWIAWAEAELTKLGPAAA
jgi:hypothetical protein